MLFVCNEKFERIGYVGNFSYLLWRKRYGPGSEAELHVDVTMKNIELLKKGNILYRQDDNEAMYIYYRQFDDSGGVDQLVVKCFSLTRWTDRRILWKQYDFNETPENIMRRSIAENMISPTETARKIVQVQLATSKNIGKAIQQQIAYKQVNEVCENLCATYDIGMRCLFDGRTLKYDFYEGSDRTINQSLNPRIILSKSRGNLLKRTYEDANNDFKNTVLIAGAGEGFARKTATIGNGNSGLNRREVFIDAREISDEKDVYGEQVPIPDNEYKNLLITKGKEKLAEYAEFIGFDCELDVTKENTKYNEDFYLGDLITIKDDELGILMNSRVMQADEVFQDSGKSVFIIVGKSTPTVFEKMQSEIKNAKGVGAKTGGGSGSGNGQPGTPGLDGVGLNYKIEGTSIGIKREDETNYTYVNTKGEQGRDGRDGVDGQSFTFADLTPAQKEELRGERGSQGLPGVKGDKGDKGDTGLQGPIGSPGPQGVKGNTGATGPQGIQGIKGDTGNTGEIGPLGPKGDTGAVGPQGEKGPQGLTGPKGDTGAIGAQGPRGLDGPQGIQGPKGDTGAQGPQGIQGPKGDTGAQGLPGIQGLKGDTGAQGLPGIQGPIGLQGEEGLQGIPGPRGLEGPKGAAGSPGAKGDTGLQGPQGIKGATGATGLQGPKGEKGDAGVQGIKGEKGDIGPIGPRGPQGIQGPQGERGPQGLPGEGTGDNYMMIDGKRVNWSLGINPTTDGLIFIYE